MTDADVPAQVERLRELFASDPTDPPAGWDAVRAFEAQHGVTLPEPFRTFTATVTSGGTDCGPDGYGLTTLTTPPPGALSAPFPLTEAWIWYDEDDGEDDEEAFAKLDQGILPLGTHSSNWCLVVTGAHRGHVWEVGQDGAQPFGREFGFTTGCSGFLGWVEHWHARTKEFGSVDWWDVDSWDVDPPADAEPPAPPEPGRLPVLTAAQRVEALRRSRAAQDSRAQAWKSISTGATTLAAVLDAAKDDVAIGKTHLAYLVWALPHLRRGDVDAVLEQAGISPYQRASPFAEQKRRALFDVLDRWRPEQRTGDEV